MAPSSTSIEHRWFMRSVFWALALMRAAVRAAKYAAPILVLFTFCFFYGAAFALFVPFIVLPFVIPIVVLLLLVIWALPDFKTGPTNALTILFFLFFGGLVLWPNYLAIAIPGLPWMTVLRLTGVPLVFILLICVSVSADFRKQMKHSLQAAPLLWKLLVCFTALQLFSLVFSDAKGESMQRLTIALVNWVGIFFASCYLFRKPGRLRFWASMIWAMAAILCVMSVIEARAGHVLWAGHIPSIFQIENPDVERILAGAVRSAIGVYRIQATFSTALGLGEYMALSMPFVLQFAVGNYRPLTRLAALATIPGMFFAVIAADSRLGFIGCMLSVLLTVFVSGFVRWRRDVGSVIGPAIVFSFPLVGASFGAATFLVGRLRAKVWGTGAQQISTQGRIVQWHMGWPKILSVPWGHGYGRGAWALGFYTPGNLLTIDSYYLSLLLEEGFVGFVLYMAMFIYAIYEAGLMAMRYADQDEDTAFLFPIAIALINFIIVKSVFSQDDNHPLVYMMLGAVLALKSRVAPSRALVLRAA